MIGVIIITSFFISGLYGSAIYCLCKAFDEKIEVDNYDNELEIIL